MYLYYDRYGTLKEQITFNPARVGNSNVNKIFVYWEGVEEFPDWAQELALQTRYLLQDNTQYPSATTFGFSAQPETAELPFDKNQDLKYFKYYKEYKFLTIDIPDEVLSYNGAVKSYIWVLNADKKRILGLGVFAFMVDGDINEVIPDENISLAQWNMISAQLGLLSGSVIDVTCDIATNTLKVYYANGLTAIRNLPPNGAQTTISSDFLREMIFSADTWVQDGENGYYIYFRAETVGYEDNKFFVQLEKDGEYNSDYYNKTGSFVLSDNIFKGSDGSVLLYSHEPYSGRLLVVGGKLLSGDSLVTGLTYNDENSQLTYKTADGITHSIYLGIEQKFDKSNVSQTTGDSTDKVMSQKSTTDEITALKSDLADIESVFVAGKNLYNVSNKVQNNFIDQTTGELSESTSYTASDWIEVDFDTDYVISNSIRQYNATRYALYTKNKVFISGALADTSIHTTETTKYVRFSDLNARMVEAQLEKGTTATGYEEYKPIKYIKESALPTSVSESIADTAIIKERFIYNKNLYNPADKTVGCFVNQNNGVLDEASAHTSSGWIVVEPSTNYAISNSDSIYSNTRCVFYTDEKVYISGTVGQNTVTSPATAKYARFSDVTSKMSYAQFEKGSLPTSYEPYGVHLGEEYAPISNNFIVNLPSKIYALVGEELNIFFDNIVSSHDTDYTFDVTCNKGIQLERCYRITPIAEDVGTYSFSIRVTSKNGGTVTKSASLIITDAYAGNNVSKSIIILGDSTTNNGQVIVKLHEDFSEDVMSITTLGTRGTMPNNHEGRSGWDFAQYFTRAVDAVDPTVLNPFYNPDTQTFDASYYFGNSGISVPDWFFINLGINDVFYYASDDDVKSAFSLLFQRYDAMIASVKDANASIKVGLALTIPPNYSQDAFGKAYKCGQTRDRYKRNNAMWVAKMIEKYDGRESDGIYLIPIHTNLDTIYNMGFEATPQRQNARNEDATYNQPIANGGVHPVISGYWQVADIYHAFLKAHASD